MFSLNHRFSPIAGKCGIPHCKREFSAQYSFVCRAILYNCHLAMVMREQEEFLYGDSTYYSSCFCYHWAMRALPLLPPPSFTVTGALLLLTPALPLASVCCINICWHQCRYCLGIPSLPLFSPPPSGTSGQRPSYFLISHRSVLLLFSLWLPGFSFLCVSGSRPSLFDCTGCWVCVFCSLVSPLLYDSYEDSAPAEADELAQP